MRRTGIILLAEDFLAALFREPLRKMRRAGIMFVAVNFLQLSSESRYGK